MDPTHAIIDSLILPYAAFHKEPSLGPSTNGKGDGTANGKNGVQESNSISNAQNGAHCLCLAWDIDGGETDRGFFCTVPTFARHKPPLRVTTTMVWDHTQYSPELKEGLELDAFFRAGKRRIYDLPLTKHIRKALTYWSNQRPDFESEYNTLPFGSTIVVDSLDLDFTKMKVRVLPNPAIEQSWLSIDALADELSLPVESLSSRAVPWDSLELVSHAHENISIVRIAGQPKGPSFIFKALMEDTHYMYHELRLLLSMESHPNIIAKPPALIVKSRSSGEPGVAGFLLELIPGPTLQERLHAEGREPVAKMNQFNQKATWACQLASALLHVRNQPTGYFPDFKPNNIVFTRSSGEDKAFTNPVLLDFEQRGTWYTWAPPEVRYVEYLELLALTSGEESVRERYGAILREAFPHWTTEYNNRPPREAKDGYNLAWVSLDTHARNKAQMYAFGKVLWCIFEGVPTPDGPHNVESFLEDFDQDQQFPEFRQSPPVIQKLIRRCTAGAPEWGDRHPGVVRDGDRIVPWGKEGSVVTAQETQEAATRWWREELSLAEGFVRQRYVHGGQSGQSEHIAQLERDIKVRPSLEEVLEILSGLLVK